MVDTSRSSIIVRVFRIDKRVYLPCSRVEQWIVIIYDQQRRFDGRTVDGMVDGLMQACNVVGSHFDLSLRSASLT